MNQLNFNKLQGLVPVIIQHADTAQVLMLGFMNEEAYQKTLETKQVWFYSRIKKRLWMKGETSGNSLNVIRISSDCDEDTLLIQVRPRGPTCHTGEVSCFGGSSSEGAIRRFYPIPEGEQALARLQNGVDCASFTCLQGVILDRQKNMPKNSYTTSLFRDGLDQMCAKVEEESDEVIKAAKQETRQRLIEEVSDLFYHTLVLMVEKGVSLGDIEEELERRQK
ncbi:bifunctional phosphoribosyl-AMP cyclohydrolase/phosphoribosyl-ATP diphosphatase [Candidatus Peregrinibacteria bacterium CG_4_10_14_0_2_um_filter_43_11]|nr:MAG: bifunctional phosphoribosyl-AMP cyclohydrolase/phosphoribosyl-ATP diphosphatase [Candidatus Peregrinibacteria bacterium CG_4_10_14_0_2_um_filter_43_11]